MRKKLLRIGLFFSLIGGSLGCSFSQPESFEALLQDLYRETVPLIYTGALQEQIDSRSKLLLLDTRSVPEFEVSHLPGAIFLHYDSFSEEAVRDWPRHQPVVVYCSVGYRSERIGEKLQQLGFTDVRNLYGGIFQWVNEGRPVHNARGLTNQVHPYSGKWGRWLQKGEQVYEP